MHQMSGQIGFTLTELGIIQELIVIGYSRSHVVKETLDDWLINLGRCPSIR